jgi:hypothetical protein
MPTTLASGNIVQTTVVCTSPGQVAIHNLYHRVALLVGAPVNTLDVATEINAALSPILRAIMAPYASYYGVQSRVFFPLNNERWVPKTTLSGVGTATGNPMATQTCGLIRLTGSVWGGAGAGRWYLPFPSVADDDTAASPGPTYLTNADAVAQWVATLLVVPALIGTGTASLQSVLINRTTKVTNDIQVATVADAWATQIRRSAFGKLNRAPF